MKNTNDYEYNKILSELYNTEYIILNNSFKLQEHSFSELFNFKIMAYAMKLMEWFPKTF